MGSIKARISVLLATVSLGACGAPFAQNARYDRAVHNAPGTITVSDPKLYPREALINERARDIAWIDKLIDDSENPTKVSFKPDIYREVEQISAFAAAIGLSFDPAAGQSFRRDSQTSKIQQEIDTLKLQLQLEQLKKDAELVRAKFASQVDPVNANLGTLGSGDANDPTNSSSASSADQLKGAIDKLLPALTSRLDAEGKPIAPTSVTPSPYDDFRDRSAYRDLLKSARNSASLDQLHDAGDAQLIRLNFQTTILPDRKYLRSLGAVQVRVVQPTSGAADAGFLDEWLRHINSNPKLRAPDGSILTTPTTTAIEAAGFTKTNLADVPLLLPHIRDEAGSLYDAPSLINKAAWATGDARDSEQFNASLDRISSVDARIRDEALAGICGGMSVNQAGQDAESLFDKSEARIMSFGFFGAAAAGAAAAGKALPDYGIDTKRARAIRYRDAVISAIKASDATEGNDKCRINSARIAPNFRFRWHALASDGASENVRIYEVGPREQVQQISTVARSANSLALAVSIAASAPSSGIGGNGAGSYARQAVGRASTLERAPSVVGYSTASTNSFGWVLGPRAVLNPKGKLEMEHLLKPYDLSVDFSVPGWWPEVELEIVTAWGPSPAALTSGDLLAGKTQSRRRVKVPLARRDDSFEAFSKLFLRDEDRAPVIDTVIGGPVNACSASTLLIRGDELWRSDRVLILGRLLKTDAIAIAPDMKGILVTVPAIQPLAGASLDEQLIVMTPSGISDPYTIRYLSTPSGNDCSAGKAQAAAAPAGDAVTISKVLSPLDFVVPSTINVTVDGANLGKVVAVQLFGQPGTFSVSGNGKSLTVTFDDKATSSITDRDDVRLVFFEKDKDGALKEAASKPVRVRPRGS